MMRLITNFGFVFSRCLSVFETTIGSPENAVSQTTAVVKLKGSIDVLVTPLMLEASQRSVLLSVPLITFTKLL